MTSARARDIKELMDRSLYVVDERAVAEAMWLHTAVRAVLPDPGPRGRFGIRAVRSFRHEAQARSFRLASRRPGVVA